MSLLGLEPLLFVLADPFRSIAAGALLVGGSYVGLRRRLADLAPVVFGYVPDAYAGHVPDRYRR